MSPMDKENQLDTVFENFTSNLARFNGILFQNDNAFRAYYKGNIAWLKHEDDSFPMSLSSFYYSNPVNGELVIGGEYDVLKSDFKESILFMRRKVHNYYVAQAFECFETFLKSTLSIHLYFYYELLHDTISALKDCAHELSDIRARIGRINSFERFKLARKIMGYQYYTDNNLYLDHLQFIYTIEQMRHSITHSSDEFIIKEADLKNSHRVNVLNRMLINATKGTITLDLSRYSVSKSVLEQFAVIAHILNYCGKS